MNTTSEIIIYLGGSGITDTVRSWGAVLQKAYNTTRLFDVSLEKLGYFTDNGAFYNHPNKLSIEKDLVETAKVLSQNGLSPHYLQLDDWWYGSPKTYPVAVRCK